MYPSTKQSVLLIDNSFTAMFLFASWISTRHALQAPETLKCTNLGRPVVGIYKRKQESEETRKHAFGPESDQGKNKENKLSIKKATKKKGRKTRSRPRK